METTLNLMLIVVLLAANGFFVAAEFALVKARGSRIQSLADQGSTSARLTVRIQENLEAYLAACQLGITMASLGLGWVGEPAVAALLEPLFTSLGMPQEMLHTTAFIIGFLIFSSLHIVIGEQLPKTIAIRRSEPVSLWCAYPLHICYLAVWPLNWLLNKATSILLKRFGVAEASHMDVYTGEELHSLVKSSGEHGHIHETKANMLSNLFEFYQRQVSSVMIPRTSVACLDISAAPDVNLAMINQNRHSRFPVVDSQKEDAIVGLLLVKDIQRAMIMGDSTPWEDLVKLCRDPLVVPESQPVPELFETMRTKRAHMALVVDEYGDFIGIVTLEDLLEEIVGEIHDETDAEPQDMLVKISDNEWDVDGLISLNDLYKATGVTLPEEKFVNTLSGLFMERLGRLAEPGDQVIEGDYRFTVVTLDERRVGVVRVVRESTQAELPESTGTVQVSDVAENRPA